MFEILERCLNRPSSDQADLVQMRGQKRKITTCTVRSGVVEEFSQVSLNGVCARVLADGRSWGFSSTNKLDSESAGLIVENALNLAKASSKHGKQKIQFEPARALKASISAPIKKPLHDCLAEEIVKIPFGACRGAREAGQKIVNSKATYISMEDDKYFLSSEGSCIHQTITRVMLFMEAMAKNSAVICPVSENLGHAGGLELFDKAAPYELGKSVAEKAVRLLDAKAPPSGQFTAVIHPTLCATLLHEAIGHPLEADLAMSGGGFGNEVGKLVSSELVTIYDDGRVKGGLGYFPYDDEGVKCKHNVLIENGVLKSFMHDRTSAALVGLPPSGNAHAWDYSVEPLIRQTNIGIEPGDWSREEMVKDVKEGLFLEGTFGGQADASADFTFGFQSARWIKNGELGQELRGANVAGNAIEVFKTVDAIGDEVVLRPGACGKSQFAVQGRVVPAVRCKIMVGGTGG